MGVSLVEQLLPAGAAEQQLAVDDADEQEVQHDELLAADALGAEIMLHAQALMAAPPVILESLLLPLIASAYFPTSSRNTSSKTSYQVQKNTVSACFTRDIHFIHEEMNNST